MTRPLFPRAGFEWLLAWRIVRARKSRFLNVITTVAVVGIAFGVMQLTIVLSVTGGFQEAFRDRILGLHPHILVWPRDDEFSDYRQSIALLESDPRILGATPATYDEMMIAHGDHRAGAVVKGLELATAHKVLNLEGIMKDGKLSSLNEQPSVGRTGDAIQLDNLVQETSWTVILWGDDQVLVHEDQPVQPFPDEASVTIIHAAPKRGAIDVALKNSEVALTSDLKPGKSTRPVTLPSGLATLAIDTSQELELESGQAYLYILGDAGGRLVPVNGSRPAAGEAAIRVVDARPAGAAKRRVVVGAETIPSGETRTVAARMPGIILGSALARRLGAKVGDSLAMSTPFRGLGDRGMAPVGMEPTSGRFKVGGIFESGYFDYDKRFAIVEFAAARRFLNTGDRAKWLEVKVDDVFQIDTRKQLVQDLLQPYSLASFATDIDKTVARLDATMKGEVSQFEIEEPETALGLLRNSVQLLTLLRTNTPHAFSRSSDYAVITWDEVNEPLFMALKLQKLVLSVFFLIIIVVAAFNVVGTQIMMVHQKTREIAILKALGANRWRVRKVFLIQGFIVSFLGVMSGVILGLLCCLALDKIGYPLEPEVYLISKLPVQIDLLEVGVVCAAALLLTFLATLYSAGKAGRLMPVDGIRYIE